MSDDRYDEWLKDMPDIETVIDLAFYAGNLQQEFPEWRHGQACFNALSHTRPALAESLRRAEADPFYDDAMMPFFWAWLYENWTG